MSDSSRGPVLAHSNVDYVNSHFGVGASVGLGMPSPDTDYTLAFNGDSVLSGGIAILYLFMDLLSELANQKYLEMQEKAKVSRDAQDKANEVNEVIAKVSKEGDQGAEPLPQDVIDYMRENGIEVDGKSIDDYLKHPQSPMKNVVVHLTSSDGQKLDITHSNGQYYTYSMDGDKGYTLISDKIKDGKITSFSAGDNPGEPITLVKDGVTYTGTVPDYQSLSELGYDDSSDGLAEVKLNKGQLEAVKDALENVSNRASDFVSQAQLQLQKIMQTYNVSVSMINSMQTMLQEMNKSIAQNIR
ncbi:secretion protein EspA [Parashewanella curva]|uniref:secretion protein EspA n=1 Tax=Parashewanella curva TaxID=2338552 RepID=UPI001FB388C2|nr:secretion protein EspA [Parashewanella curva]